MDFSKLDRSFRFAVSEFCATIDRIIDDASRRHGTPEETTARLKNHLNALAESIVEAFPEKPRVALGQAPTNGG